MHSAMMAQPAPTQTIPLALLNIPQLWAAFQPMIQEMVDSRLAAAGQAPARRGLMVTIEDAAARMAALMPGRSVGGIRQGFMIGTFPSIDISLYCKRQRRRRPLRVLSFWIDRLALEGPAGFWQGVTWSQIRDALENWPAELRASHVAEILGCSETFARELMGEGGLVSRDDEAGMAYVTRDNLAAWIERVTRDSVDALRDARGRAAA